jgi:hypothetical protein
MKRALLAATLLGLLGTTGCHRNTREEAKDDVGDAAEKAGDKTEDAADAAGDAAENAGDKAEDATDPK